MTPIFQLRFLATKPSRNELPDENDKTLGAVIKRKRLELGWTKIKTANHLKTCIKSYRWWEANKSTPEIHNKKKLIEFLGHNYWDDNTDSIGNRCYVHRIEYGLLRKELGDKLNLCSATIQKIEEGKKVISEKTFRLVDQFLSKEI